MEGALLPAVSLLAHVQQLSLEAAPLQLVQLVVALDHTDRRPTATEQEHRLKNVQGCSRIKSIIIESMYIYILNLV